MSAYERICSNCLFRLESVGRLFPINSSRTTTFHIHPGWQRKPIYFGWLGQMPRPPQSNVLYLLLLCYWGMCDICLWGYCTLYIYIILIDLGCRGYHSWESIKKLCYLPFKTRHKLKVYVCSIQIVCLSNNLPKWISSSYIWATNFELTNPVVQHICDFKKHFRWHNVLLTSLVERMERVLYSIKQCIYPRLGNSQKY